MLFESLSSQRESAAFWLCWALPWMTFVLRMLLCSVKSARFEEFGFSVEESLTLEQVRS
jgi:hypothetical protein